MGLTRRALRLRDKAQAQRIAGDLNSAGYTQAAVAELLGFGGLAAPVERLGELRQRASGYSPLDINTRLWFLGDSVPAGAARECVPGLDCWAECGLLDIDGDRVRPLVSITAVQGLLLVADPPQEVRDGATADHVMGPAQSSLLIARAMANSPMTSVLDVGTGSGYLALLAARTASTVCATDLNPRATAMARFNAQLNGAANVETVTGSLFEPLADQRFDLIVSSPPYLISPGAGLMFCESGWRGDLFCRRLLRDAARHLNDDGICQIVCNWPHRADESWEEPVIQWFEDTGCDALVLGGNTQDAASYASNWIRDTRARDEQTFQREFALWKDYLAREGIEQISYGVVTLRRRSGANWVQCEPTPDEYAPDSGSDILRRFRLRDYLDRTSDGDLLDATIVVAPGMEMALIDGEAGNRSVRPTHGLIRPVSVDANIAGLIERCTGAEPLRITLETIAGELGVPVEQLVPMALGTVRGLVNSGILQPLDLDNS